MNINEEIFDLLNSGEDLKISNGTLWFSRGKRTHGVKIGAIEPSLRVLLAERLQRSVLGAVAGDLPANVIPSIEERSHAPSLRRHILLMRTLRDALVLRYRYSGARPPYFRQMKAFEPRRLFVLADVVVSPYSGLTWLPDGRVFQESVGSMPRLLWWGKMRQELLQPSRSMATRRPVIACPYPGNYCHWVTETLPALLHGLSYAPDALILVDRRRSPPILFEALEALLGKRWMARVRLAEGPVRVRRLVMPQQQEHTHSIHPKDIAMLASAFEAFTDRTRGAELLYVSRSAARDRPLAGEAALEQGLSALGFRILHGHELTLREQIQAFSRARVIIAPHGAGLTNLIWARRPCRVLEIFPAESTGFFNDVFHRISAIKGFRHDYLMCTPEKSAYGRIPVDKVLAWARLNRNT